MPVSEVLHRDNSMLVSPLVSFAHHTPSSDEIAFFTFRDGDRVVWMAPNTRPMYAVFVSSELKADGKEYSVISLPDGGNITVMSSDLTPAFD